MKLLTPICLIYKCLNIRENIINYQQLYYLNNNVSLDRWYSVLRWLTNY